jgi:hypothetical protein
MKRIFPFRLIAIPTRRRLDMRRNTTLAAVIAVAVLVAGLVSSGSATTPSSPAAKESLRFSIVEQDRAQGRTHPVVAPADVIATTFTLLKGSRTVGRAQNACIAMPDAAVAVSGVAQCTQTFFLTRGQIVVVRARFAQPHHDPAVIVGGTGAYRGARGNATIAATDSPAAYRVTFELTYS